MQQYNIYRTAVCTNMGGKKKSETGINFTAEIKKIRLKITHDNLHII